MPDRIVSGPLSRLANHNFRNPLCQLAILRFNQLYVPV